MVTIDMIFNYSLVLIAIAGGAYTIGYTIGKLSSKRK